MTFFINFWIKHYFENISSNSYLVGFDGISILFHEWSYKKYFHEWRSHEWKYVFFMITSELKSIFHRIQHIFFLFYAFFTAYLYRKRIKLDNFVGFITSFRRKKWRHFTVKQWKILLFFTIISHFLKQWNTSFISLIFLYKAPESIK